MNSRETILRDIREALRTPIAHEHEDAGPSRPESVAPAGSFRERFEAAGGIWYEARDRQDAVRYIASVARPKVWVSRGPLLDTLDLPFETLRTRDYDVNTVLTEADLALAETGSFGMESRPGQGRLSSLIAPIHIALLSRDRIVERLEDVLAWAKKLRGSAAILATGPSRTADIEQTLTIGVHGPGKVYAVLL